MKFWENKIGYQVYPMSYYDSNNDGKGDFIGLYEKVDYIKDLGVDLVWINPVYKTSFIDGGYDIEDYYNVNEQMGSEEELFKFINKCNDNNIMVVMDYVLNHTSSKHVWFKDIIENGKDSKYYDYYMWADEPNDMISIFGGSSWEYVESTNQYYYHLFDKSQPDLNWHNENVRKEIQNIMNFWINKGVKGFRLDAIEHISKDFENKVYSYGPDFDWWLKELYENTFNGREDIFVVGEASNITPDLVEKFTKGEYKFSEAFFNFGWFKGWNFNSSTQRDSHDKKELFENLEKWNKIEDSSTIINFLSNHDTSRVFDRLGSKKYLKQSIQSISSLLMFWRGMPFVYYGEEIGMVNPNFKNITDFRDVEVSNNYQIEVLEKKNLTEEQYLKRINNSSRDMSRTPMQWDDCENAGFNQGNEPWISAGTTYKDINVSSQINDQDSILSWYKQIIDFRKNSKYSDAICYGDLKFVFDKDILTIRRSHEDTKIRFVINMSDEVKPFTYNGELIMSNQDYDGKNLQPWTIIAY